VPLVTDNIEEARTAYSALEARARSAEDLAQTLRAELDKVRARPQLGIHDVHDIRQVLLNREADNEKLRIQLQQAIVTKADLALENFIASIGMAAAVGEATMQDRVISSLSATLQTYVTPTDTSVGLRFFQPGVDGHRDSLSSTTFEIARVPPPAGVPAPRNLYTVLLEKQNLYSNAFWARFTTNTSPPGQPANDIVVAVAVILANAGTWSFPYLLQSAAALGNSEKTLAALVSAVSPGNAATAYSAAVSLLLALTTALTNKRVAVAGDLLALTASLDNVTSVARTLLT
jgi:hypothetical protein